jgi:hypothetical protein
VNGDADRSNRDDLAQEGRTERAGHVPVPHTCPPGRLCDDCVDDTGPEEW